MKIGLLGGTFNPVHYGHLFIARQIKERCQLDQVLLMPTYVPPHKKTISATDRLNMLKLAVANDDELGIEPIEIQRQAVSYSYDTMKQLTTAHPENDYYFIIGGDMVEYLPHWHRIDELLELVTFIGVDRPGYQVTSDYPIWHVELPQLDISSSLIRQFCRSHQSVRYLLPDEVIQYIFERRLYND